MDVFVARQPIFNREHKVIAYELLYRESEKNVFTGNVASDVATSILLMNSYFSFGLNTLVGKERAFINFEKRLIEENVPSLLNKEQVVIEILENVVPDARFLKKVQNLKANGYTIAVDDVVYNYAYQQLLELADIIKVDFLGNTKEQIEEIFNKWKPHGKLLLAEKVESREEYHWAKELGFDYFQGYFFSKPAVMKKKNISGFTTQYTQLLRELNQPEPDNKRIAMIIETDVTLTYRLLKLVNSRLPLGSHVTSITHALAILGTVDFEKWLSLASLQNVASSQMSEVIKISMARSKFLENISKSSLLKKHTRDLTLIGILSVLDALLECPMTEVVKTLPLSDDLRNTLIGKETPYLPVYTICLNYERGLFSNLDNLCKRINYPMSHLPKDYSEAVLWAEDLFAYMIE